MTNTAELLRSKDISPSVQRIAIFDYLKAHHNHPIVDDIYKELSQTIPTLSKTTIYNTLTLFMKHDLIRSFQMGDTLLHFDEELRPHAHFKCQHCGTIYDVPMTEITLLPLDGFDVVRTELYYFGVCKQCKENQENV